MNTHTSSIIVERKSKTCHEIHRLSLLILRKSNRFTEVTQKEKPQKICSGTFLYLLLNLVNLRGNFWNTLWLDLVRIDEEFTKLDINPEDIKYRED